MKVPGLEARAKVKRYRELYDAINSKPEEDNRQLLPPRNPPASSVPHSPVPSDDELDLEGEEGGEEGEGYNHTRATMYSLYTDRGSFMDTDRSGRARERLVRGVEAMGDDRRQEEEEMDGEVVPPVPRLVLGVGGSRSVGRF